MQSILHFISQPMPWYVAGPLIGAIILALQWLDNKPLAASSSYRHLCAAAFPSNIPFLKYDWKAETWNLFFAFGILAGGFLAGYFLQHPSVELNNETTQFLQSMGLKATSGFAPEQLFSFSALKTVPGILVIIGGGFLIGFGSRYAGGCVSGHSMTGISDLQWTSMLATMFIFAGGIFTAYVLLPFILKINP